MKNEIIQNNKECKIIRYKTKNGFMYFTYLYDLEKYKLYKNTILSKSILMKVIKVDGYIKFIYKKGYNPCHRISYYIGSAKVGILTAKKYGLA